MSTRAKVGNIRSDFLMIYNTNMYKFKRFSKINILQTKQS